MIKNEFASGVEIVVGGVDKVDFAYNLSLTDISEDDKCRNIPC